MSAYNVGVSAFAAEEASGRSARAIVAAGADTDEKKKAIEQAVAPTRDDALGIIVRWVPGEVIGTYGAVVAAMQVIAKDKPGAPTGAEGGLLVIFVAISFAMSLLAGWLAFRRIRVSGKMPRTKRAELWMRGLLACVGLVLWSYVIPGTVTNQSGLAQRFAGASALVFLVAIVFGLFAEFMVSPTTLRALRMRGD